MCGILGMVGTPWLEAAPLALATLRSRGPDEQTTLNLGETVFCHTRLAVTDLLGGHQPMRTVDGRYTIIFNGEIYNAPALRKELEAAGEIFLTDHSDTEVLLLGYRAWGAAILPRLDGMFAFAVWDAHTRRLFAARDRVGIKPFMYAAVAGGLVFASTLAPFFALPDFPRQIDPEALRDYLAFQTVLAPQTFLRDVRQLPPAHSLVFDADNAQLTLTAWWRVPPAPAAGDSPEHLIADADAAIRESVTRQLMADVPLGAFLSGGIDSSLMVKYLSEQSRTPVRTFSMRFSDDQFDESRHARAVAALFGCEHHEFSAPDVTGDYFAGAIADLDQPLADPAYVMTHALSRLTREHVTVAISGDGGDELFGGYARFLKTADQYPAKVWHAPMRRLIDAGLLPAALLRRTLSGGEMLHYQRVELGPWPGRKDLRQLLSPGMAARVRPEKTLALWRELLAEQGPEINSDALMRADLWTYLSENCLGKTDRASMAHGLEVRVPLLGQPVIDFALRQPAAVHLKGSLKSILTGLARKELPETVWNREKHGFSVPLHRYFNAEWQGVADDAFARCATIAPFLNASAVHALWSDGKAGKASRRLVYTVLVLLLWLDGKGMVA